ncbi:MAG TPA: hypothetical protein PK239_02635 [Chitinophagales bacterium]|nr:hypothetical protein [Chitinophagales bacterium]
MPSLASLLKFAAQASWLGISRLVFWAVAGLALNIALFFWLPNLCATAQTSFCAAKIAAIVLFWVVFPVGYAVVAYKFAIQKVIHFAYVQNKDYFYAYTVNRLADFLDRNKLSGSVVGGGGKLIGRFFDKLDNMPFVFRAVLKFLKNMVPIGEIVERATKNEGITPENETRIAARIAEETDKYIGNELLMPDYTLHIMVLVVNIAVFGLFMWLAR